MTYSIGFAAIAIFVYYAIQFISNSLAITQLISAFWSAWLPNLIDFSLGYFFLHRDKRYKV
jgi:lipopolysaccharide export LptBFGC system permease protein LptF